MFIYMQQLLSCFIMVTARILWHMHCNFITIYTNTSNEIENINILHYQYFVFAKLASSCFCFVIMIPCFMLAIICFLKLNITSSIVIIGLWLEVGDIFVACQHQLRSNLILLQVKTLSLCVNSNSDFPVSGRQTSVFVYCSSLCNLYLYFTSRKILYPICLISVSSYCADSTFHISWLQNSSIWCAQMIHSKNYCLKVLPSLDQCNNGSISPNGNLLLWPSVTHKKLCLKPSQMYCLLYKTASVWHWQDT